MSERGVRPRAVVDSNLFVSGAISPIGAPRHLLIALNGKRFDLLLSDRQHAELNDVFVRPKLVTLFSLSHEELDALFATLDATPRVPLSPTLPLPVRDPKDEHLLAAAIGGRADYLVTGDKDLLVLAGDPRLGALQIVTAAEFLDVLDQESPER